jgi:hypothetical protein
MIIAAQFIKLLSSIFEIMADRANNKNKMLIYNGIYNTLSGIQYLLLNAITGALCSFLTIIRNIIMYIFKKDTPLYIVIIYFILLFFINLNSINSLLTFLPVLLVMIYTMALYTNDIKVIKISVIITCSLEIIYDYVFHAYVGIAVCIIDIILVALSMKKIK